MTGSNVSTNSPVDNKKVDTKVDKKGGLGGLNDLVMPIDVIEEKIEQKRIEPEKPKRKRGRPSKKEQVNTEAVEQEAIKAVMEQAGAKALLSVIALVNGLVKKRFPSWQDLDNQESESLSQALNAVIIKYMPNIAGHAEEFSLAMILFAVIGKRVPALTEKKQVKSKA